MSNSGLRKRWASTILLGMKVFVIVMLTAVLQIKAADIHAQHINLSERNVSLSAVLNKIRVQSNYDFIYNDDLIKRFKNVSVTVKNGTLKEALDETLSGLPVSFVIEDKIVIIKRKPLVTSSAVQDSTVNGQVVDATTKQPIPGANISVQNSNAKAQSDVNGNFKIAAAKGSLLNVSYVGYQSTQIAVGSGKMMISLMESNEMSLNDVVVVGYATQKRVNLTGSVSTLNMREKEGQPITNASNALHGVSGLFVNQFSSQPGLDRSTIRVRGIGTLNNSNPLVFVNGVEYPMDEINPNDILNITVLKDASAAIYGSRAANGVILVTTKEGSGKSSVNYGYYVGTQQATFMPDVVWDPIVYMKAMNTAYKNEGKGTPAFTDAQIAEYEEGMKTDPFTYPATDWFDVALGNGTIQKHDFSVSGSDEKFRYRLSLGYLNHNGIVIGPGNKENKYSIGLNTSYNVSKRLKIGFSLDGNYRNYTEPAYGMTDFFNSLMRTLPIMNDTLANGSYGSSYLRVSGRNNWEHPRMLAQEGYYKMNIQRFISTLSATYTLPWNLTYNVKFGADKYDGLLKNFVPLMYKEDAKTGASIAYNSAATAPRSGNYDYNNLNIHVYNTLEGNYNIAKDHGLNVLLGQSYDNYGTSTFMAQMVGYLDGSLDALSAGSIFNAISGNSTEDVLSSYFGRVNYDYKGKYLLEGIFRYDGSSRFAKNNRWGFFPGVSAGWRIDQESFFKSDVINLLKLRASVGKLGNQAVPLYSYTNAVALGQDYAFGGANGILVPGAAATAYSDPTISWESTTTHNIGIDASLFDNRLNITAELYNRRTSGILRSVPIPAQVGNLTGPQRNVGVMDNKGYEFNIQYKDKINELSYSVAANVSGNKNEVVSLNDQILYNLGSNLSTITKAGYAVNSFYLYDAIGIFQSDAEVAASAFQSQDTKAGYLKYRDVNGDNIINGDDRIIVNASSALPKLTYSFNLNLDYKRFTFDAYLQGVTGIKIYPTARLVFPLHSGSGITKEWVGDTWTPENTDAKLPILVESGYGSNINYQPSTFWLRNGSYLRLQNVQLSYRIPEKMLAKAKISRLNVFVNAQNLFTISDYKGADPESAVNDLYMIRYPMLKTFSGGLNIVF